MLLENRDAKDKDGTREARVVPAAKKGASGFTTHGISTAVVRNA
jgi:hypothetical protein